MGYRSAVKMPSIGWAGALVAALVGLPANAYASSLPLRTLSFTVDVRVSEVRASPGEGIRAPRPAPVVTRGRVSTSNTAVTTGSGERTVGAAFKASGLIDVDVMSATDDAGLVVDVAENALERKRPRVRVLLGPDGTVSFDPKNGMDLTEEELAVVRWLARGFYGDHPTEPGTAWTVDQSANGHVDIEHYRVVGHEAHSVTLDYALEEKVPGATGYAALREGSLVYDTAMIVPVKATFQSETRRQIGAARQTLRTSVSLTLTADSFAKR